MPEDGDVGNASDALPNDAFRSKTAAPYSSPYSYGVTAASGFSRRNGNFYSRHLKRHFDIFGAAVILIVCSPVMAFVAISIALSDGFPIFFKQERLGKNSRLFFMLKFRTMKRDAEATLESWKASDHAIWHEYVSNNFKIRNDPRLIMFGQLLREYSLDELPQLWNVLRGEMSLVGPRPMLPTEISDYTSDIGVYESVRPGITGQWQVSGRSLTSFADRAWHDQYYVRNLTFLTDCKILLRTVLVCLTGFGAH